MGFRRFFRHSQRAARTLTPRQHHSTRLVAEELEPRALPSAGGLRGGVVHPTFRLAAARPNAGPAPPGFGPAQLADAYGFSKLTTLNGAGQTIAIVDSFHDPNIAADLHQFDLQFGLPDPTFKQVDQNGGDASNVPQDSSGDWEVEEALDVEWAHAIAPQASIVLLEASSAFSDDLLTAVDTARNMPGVVVVSMSWGGPDFSGEDSYDFHFTTPTGHAGVTFVASSGDYGVPAGYPGTSSNVVGVGGTTLTLDGNNNRTFENGWSGSGGGYTNETKTSYQATYAKSSYVQNTLGNTLILNSTQRIAPDVSYDADPNSGVAVYDSYPNGFSNSFWFAVGGTSAGAPQWAALMALVAQGRGKAGSLDGVTQTLPALYQFAADPTAYPRDFFDVLNGSNPDPALPGYDAVTGLGSPRADKLIPDLINGLNSTNLSVTASLTSVTAGTAFSVTVTAQDSSSHTVTGYTGKVHFTTSDKNSQVSLPMDYTFTAADQGSHTFTNAVTLVTAGSQSVTATDTGGGAGSGSATVTVTAAAASALSLSAPASALQGAPFSVTVTAQDSYGNTATGYTGTVQFTTSDTGTGVAVPASYTFTATDKGTHTFTNAVTLVTPGSQTLTAADGSFSVTASVNVTVPQPTHFSLTAPAGATAGSAFSVTLTALDANNHTVLGYIGKVHFTTSDKGSKVSLPPDYTFTATDQGSHTFTNAVTLVTTGSQKLTATDTANSSLTGSATIAVTAAAASKLLLSAPATAGQGSPFTVAVTAQDAYGNTAASYGGTVHFTTTDTGAGVVVPADYTFKPTDQGSHTFSNAITLVTSGAQVVTATDTAAASVTGSATVSVSPPASATHFTVSAPASATAGSAFTIMVTALDPNNRTASGYRGTVHFTASDTAKGVVLPADYTFTAADKGVHTFTNAVTLITAGSQTITATDRSSPGITGRANVLVGAAAAKTLTVAGFPSPIAAGVSATFTVTAKDTYGNVATGYAGTVAFTSSDGQAGLPSPATLSNGTGTFSATLKTTGTQSLTATDTVTKSITGTQSGITVVQSSGQVPGVAGIDPVYGSTAGGDQVLIFGSNFTGATAVSFGGTPAAGFQVMNSSLIMATTPPHAAGKVDVRVTTPAGTSPISPTDAFYYMGGFVIMSRRGGPAPGGPFSPAAVPPTDSMIRTNYVALEAVLAEWTGSLTDWRRHVDLFMGADPTATELV